MTDAKMGDLANGGRSRLVPAAKPLGSLSVARLSGGSSIWGVGSCFLWAMAIRSTDGTLKLVRVRPVVRN